MQDPEKQITLGEANVEHIYPQNPESNEWGGLDNQEKLEPLTWHIGNLTIFGKRANRKVANAEYAIKRPRFQDSKVVMTNEVAQQYDHWDEKTIIGRAGKLAKQIVQVWNFDNKRLELAMDPRWTYSPMGARGDSAALGTRISAHQPKYSSLRVDF